MSWRMNRTQKAVYLVMRHGYTTARAARATGLHYNTVMKAVQRRTRPAPPTLRIVHDAEWTRTMLVMRTRREIKRAVREFAEGMTRVALERAAETL